MKTRRKCGMPRYARRVLRRERVERLPATFNLNTGAKALNIHPSTLVSWVNRGCPCFRIMSEHASRNTSYSFERDKVVAWLIANKHYHGKP